MRQAKIRQKKVSSINVGGYWHGLHEEKEEEQDEEDEDDEHDDENLIFGFGDENILPHMPYKPQSCLSNCCSHRCPTKQESKHERRMQSWQNNKMKAEIDKVGQSGMKATLHYKVVATMEESMALNVGKHRQASSNIGGDSSKRQGKNGGQLGQGKHKSGHEDKAKAVGQISGEHVSEKES